MKKITHNKTASYILGIIFSIIGSAIIAIGMKVFISPNKFVSTGFTGVGIIIGRSIDLLLGNGSNLETKITGIFYLVSNIPVLILSYKRLSIKFTVLSLVSVVATSLILIFIPDNINEVLHLSVEKGNITLLDAALFVGIFNGAGNALTYIFGGSNGGSDILSMYFSVRRQTSIGKANTIINGAIILCGMLVNGKDIAIANTFYTLIYLVVNSLVIDILYARNKRRIVVVITTKGAEISKEINSNFVRGVTKMDAIGTFTGEHKDFLYCACLSYETIGISKRVKEIDPHAFISILSAEKVHGNFISKELS